MQVRGGEGRRREPLTNFEEKERQQVGRSPSDLLPSVFQVLFRNSEMAAHECT